MDLLWRFLLGGAIVSLFAFLGDVLRPKRFAGIFGGAPSVALATLALTAHKSGALVAIAGGARRPRSLGTGGGVCGTPAVRSAVIPSLDFSSLRDARWRQFMVRFVLGGAVTLCTGLIAEHWGPVVGGLFLSFPAIFPATVTLIERHETEKKSKAGINCRKRGRKAAALDAAGAVLGGWGMMCFGCAAWLALARFPTALALTLAGVLWLIVSASLWWVRRHLSATRMRAG